MPIDEDVARLAAAMRRVDRLLESLEPDHEPLLANALLNLAVCRMLDSDGAQRTASVLTRLIEAVLTGPVPAAHCAVDLSSLQG